MQDFEPVKGFTNMRKHHFIRSSITSMAMINFFLLSVGSALPASGQDFPSNSKTKSTGDSEIIGLENDTTSPDASLRNGDATSPSTQTGENGKRYRGQSYVAASQHLRNLLDGYTPSTLEQFQAMESQQQKVVKGAAACTVSVQIGNSQGCGVIITGDGYVLTAAHVAMRQGLDAVLTLSDGSQVRGKTLGLNREVDAGLIKIVGKNPKNTPWPHATLGNSEDLRPGMWCIAMGHPGGYAKDRSVVMRVGRILAVRPGALVTDCALIGGDSGGPLFDLEGKLIGVHSRIGNDVADNLHVPVDHYDTSWNRLVAAETWGFLPGFRPVIGVRGKNDSDSSEILGIVPESSADRAGIQAGDIIQSFGGARISDFKSLIKAVGETMPGEQVIVKIRRGDATLRVVLEVGRDPNS